MSKPGTIGFIKQNGVWTKAVVVTGSRSKLGIRTEPHLYEKIIHFDDFLKKDKVKLLSANDGAVSHQANLLDNTKRHLDYWRRVFRFKGNSKIAASPEANLRTGTVGWAKVKTGKNGQGRRKWQRCMVLNILEDDLEVCFTPKLEIATIAKPAFMVERSIEHGLKELGTLARLRLKIVLRAARISYKVNQRVQVQLDQKAEAWEQNK